LKLRAPPELRAAEGRQHHRRAGVPACQKQRLGRSSCQCGQTAKGGQAAQRGQAATPRSPSAPLTCVVVDGGLVALVVGEPVVKLIALVGPACAAAGGKWAGAPRNDAWRLRASRRAAGPAPPHLSVRPTARWGCPSPSRSCSRWGGGEGEGQGSRRPAAAAPAPVQHSTSLHQAGPRRWQVPPEGARPDLVQPHATSKLGSQEALRWCRRLGYLGP
jgi:hypothetical protein